MEDFVTFDLAKKLKEKGFREKCYAYWSGGENYHITHYNFIQNPAPSRKLTIKDFYKCENWYCERNHYDAPTISQVLKWLREEKKLHIELVGNACGYLYIVSDIPSKGGTDRYCSGYSGPNDGGCWDSFEDCVKHGIEYTLNNLI